MNAAAKTPRTVYIDTTELYQRHLLHTKDWEDLLERAERGQVKLVFSEVVLQEAERQYIESLDKSIASDARHVRDLRTQGFESVEQNLAPQRDKLSKNYRSTVEAKIGRAGGEVLPLPNATHQELLDRAKRRRKPFNSNGKGYQDALVWHSILEHMEEHSEEFLENPPALVTDNHSDYCEKSGELAHQLQAEISEIEEGLTLERMGSIRDVIEELRDDFKDEDQVHRQKLLYQTAAPAEDEEDYGDEAAELDTRIAQAVEGAAEKLLGQPVRNWDGESRGRALVINYALPDELDEASIEEVEIVHNSLDYQVQDHYDGETMALTATVEATVYLEGFISKADYFILDDDSIEVYDNDWNDHYMWVRVSRTMQLTFNLITVGQTVESVEFEGAEVV